MTAWRRHDVASIESHGRAVVLPLSGDLCEQPFIFEAQAAVIWAGLDETLRSENTIIEEVASQYRVDPDLIRYDVVQFLVDLMERGLAVKAQKD